MGSPAPPIHVLIHTLSDLPELRILHQELSGFTPFPCSGIIHVFFFQDIDKFGNEITQLARPLPVEYLIIDVSVPPTCLLPTGDGQSAENSQPTSEIPSAGDS